MVTIDRQVLSSLANAVQAAPPAKPLDFYHTWDGQAHDSAMYPELNHPLAIEYFFVATVLNYGFWHGHEHGYRAPMLAVLDGQPLKGSDALWRVLKRALDKNPEQFLPEHLANLTEHQAWEQLLVTDNGPMPFPDPEQRLTLLRGYGQDCGQLSFSPSDFVHGLPLHPKPLNAFMRQVVNLTGFNQDALAKKARLLAMILSQRPEKFLKPAAGEQLGPIVDYHLMRLALRLGLIQLNGKAEEKNQQRQWVGKTSEQEIRRATFRALEEILELTGVSAEQLDVTLWNARRYCPETETPVCAKCQFNSFCHKKTGLFQPVYRTTAY